MDVVETAAKAFWDSQNARVKRSEEERLNYHEWRSSIIPQSVWDGYHQDMCVALEAIGVSTMDVTEKRGLRTLSVKPNGEATDF